MLNVRPRRCDTYFFSKPDIALAGWNGGLCLILVGDK
jgi:hypothetical protein